jgi:fibronectin-binding autotransporter adhesin
MGRIICRVVTLVSWSRAALWGVALAAAVCSPGFAAQYWWDPGQGGVTPTGGTGAWDTSSSQWSNGATDGAWPNGNPNADQATFGGTGGMVTLTSTATIYANRLTFTTGSYSLTGGTLSLSGTAVIDTGGYGATINSILAGTTGFTKLGTATLTLSNTNTYSGGTTVSAGTIAFSNIGALGSGGVTLGDVNTASSNIGLLTDLTSGTVARDIVVSNQGLGTVTIGGTAGGSNLHFAGRMTLNRSATLLGSTNGYTWYDGLISGTGTLTFASGRSIPGNSGNYFTGDVVISPGATVSPQGTGTLATASSLTVNGLLSLYPQQYGPGPQSANSLYGAGTISAILPGTAAFVVGVSGGSGSFSGAIQDGAGYIAVTKTGPGTQVFSGVNNNYSGGTTLAGGTLSISADSSLGSNTGPLAFTGGALQITGTAYIAMPGTRPISFGTGGGGLDIAAAGNTFTVSRAITGAGGLNKLGPGTLLLSGSNTFSGPTTINGGILSLTNPLALQNSTFDTTGTGSLNLGSLTSATLGGLQGANAFALQNGSGAPLALSLGGNTATFSGALTGSGSLTKIGGGTQILAGSNSYSGGTTVSSGALSFSGSGSIPGSGLITAAAGGYVGATSAAWGGGGVSAFLSKLDTANAQGVIGLESDSSGDVNLTGFGVTARLSSAGTANLSGTLTPQGTVYRLGGGGGALTISSQLTAGPTTRSLEMSTSGSLPAGSVVLAGSNSYGGGTTVSAGRLSFTGAGSIPASGLITVNSGGYAGANATAWGADANTGFLNMLDTANCQGVVGLESDSTSGIDMTNFAASARLSSAASATLSGTLTPQGTGAVYRLGGGGGTLTIASVLANVGGNSTALDINTSGTLPAGTTVLTGSNTFSGGTNLAAGILSISSDDNIAGAASTITFNGGTLRVTGTALTGFGTHTINWSSFSGGLDIAAAANTFTITQLISGTSALVKLGSGTLALSNTNTYGGGTTISAGTLAYSNVGAFGTGTITLGDANTGSGSVALLTSLTSGTFARDVTVSGQGSGTVTFGDNNTTAGGFTFSGKLNLNRPTTLVGQGAGYYTYYAGVISGNVGTLTIGSGRVILYSGGNTFTGDVAVASGATLSLYTTSAVLPANSSVAVGGTLGLGSVGPFRMNALTGTGLVTLYFPGTQSLTVGWAGGSGTFSGAIQDGGGSLAIIKAGSGTQVLSGNNSYSGGTTISGGTLQIGAGGATGSVTGDIADNAALSFNRAGALSYSGIVSGSGSLVNLGTGTVALTNTNTYSGGTTLAAGTLSVSSGANIGGATSTITFNGGVLQVTGTALVNLDTHTVNWIAFNGGLDIAAGNNKFTVTQLIAGNGGLAKLGAGTLVLTNTNTYSGGTTLAAGALSVSSDANLGGPTSTITFNGGALQITGTALTNLGAHTINWYAPNSGLDIAASNNTFTVTQLIAGSGGLAKLGAGTLVLTNTNAYSSGNTISAGTLSISSDDNIGGATSAITFNGGTLQVTGTAVTDLNSHIVNWNTFNGGFDIAAGNNTFTITQSIAGTGRLVKLGSGKLVLSGTQGTYSGGTTISAGTLFFSHTAALGSGAVTLGDTSTGASDVALLTNLNDGSILGRDIVVSSQGSGAVTIGASSTSGSVTYAGHITVNRPTTLLGQTHFTFYSGVISGTGTLTFGGDRSIPQNTGNNFSGDMIVATGAVLTPGGAQTIASAASVTVYGMLSLYPQSWNGLQSVNALNGTGLVNILYTGTSDAETLTIGQSGGSGAFSGAIQAGGAAIGPLAIVKAGAGTQVFSGNNTYAGGTTLTGGELSISADSNIGGGTSRITFSGGRLQITGTALTNLDSHGSAVNWETFNGGFDIAAADNTSTVSAIIGGTGKFSKLGSGTLVLAATNTYSGGTTLNAGRLSISADAALGDATGPLTFTGPGTLQVTGPVTLDAARTISVGTGAAGTIDTQSYTVTASGSMSGGGGLGKAGTGTLILTGANTLGGTSTVNAGILQIDNGGATGSITGDIRVAAGAALVFNRPDDYAYAGALSGSGSVSQSGPGTLVLSGNNNFGGPIAGGTLLMTGSSSFASGAALTGGTAVVTGSLAGQIAVSSGVLQIGTGAAVGAVTGDILDNATVVFNRSDNYTYTGQLSGTGALVQAGSGILTLSNPANSQAHTILSAGELSISADGNLGGAASVAFNGGILRITGTALTGFAAGRNVNWSTFDGGFDIAEAGNSFTISGAIAGGGGLLKRGSGTLVLAGAGSASSYTGGTTVQAGVLQVGDGTAVNGGLGALDNQSGSATVLAGATLRFANPNDQTCSGAISGSGGLSKMAAGTLVLDAANTFSGGTTLNAGLLSISAAANIGGATSAVTFNGGGLQITGTAVTNLDGHTVNWSTFNGTLDIAAADNTFTVSQAIGGASLGKAGSGVLALTGPNTCAAVNVSAGTLDLSGLTSALRSVNSGPAGIVALGSASISIGGGDANSTLDGAITGSGASLTIIGTGSTLLGGSNSFSGPTTLTGQGTLTLANSQALSMSILDYGTNGGSLGFGSLTAVTLGGLAGTNFYNPGSFDNRLVLANATTSAVALSVGNNGESTAFAGDILGSGSLVKIGGGTLTLSGSDSYTGGTTVLGGTLDIASVYALPGNSTLAIANTAEVVFATDLGLAIQLSLMLPGAAGGEPGMTYFRVSTAPASVPEPGTLALLAAAVLAGVAAWRRRGKVTSCER